MVRLDLHQFETATTTSLDRITYFVCGNGNVLRFAVDYGLRF